MRVTSIHLELVKEPKGKLRAYARVLLDDELQLTRLRVYEGAKGFFVSYPNDPSYQQLYYPVTKELRGHIEQEVLDAYIQELIPELFTGKPEDAIKVAFQDFGPLLNGLVKAKLDEILSAKESCTKGA